MMKITRSAAILRLLTIFLLGVVRPSHQTIYSCNPSESCGCSNNSATVSRIVGGENATSATWGWAVSISIADSDLCGGSIISSSWVITAAHCVNDNTASEITVYAGSTRPWSGTQTRVASQRIVHSSYNSSTFVNDIALLQLTPPLSMSDPYVSAICLPSVSSTILLDGEWPAPDTTVVAVGWGRLSEGGPLPSTLQQVTLQTVDYRASTCASGIVDWNVRFCAGVSGGGKDTCQGDSGGPLMMFTSSGQWVLVGLTSNGVGCARATDSGVYTRVAAFQSWINSNTDGSVSVLSSSVFSTASTPTQETFSSPASTTTQKTVSSTASTLTQKPVSTTSVAMIHLHANTVGSSIFTVFIVVLFN